MIKTTAERPSQFFKTSSLHSHEQILPLLAMSGGNMRRETEHVKNKHNDSS